MTVTLSMPQTRDWAKWNAEHRSPYWHEAKAMVKEANEAEHHPPNGTTNKEVHRASTTTDHPDFYYHSSKSENRESVHATGLEAARTLGGKDPGRKRIYLTEEAPGPPKPPSRFGTTKGRDTYRVDVRGLKLRPDPELPDKWAISEEDITPDRLQLIATTHPDGLPAKRGVTVSNTRDWAKWNLEHPYQKKGRKHGASVSKPTAKAKPTFGDKLKDFGDKDLIAGFQRDADKLKPGQAHTGKTPMTDAQYRQHRDHVQHEIVRHGSNDLLRSPFSSHVSEDRVKGIEGAYTPERRAKHEALLKHFEDQAKNVPSERRAIVTGGIGGAGKSTILRTNAKDKDSVAGKLGIKYASYDEKGNGVGEPTNFTTLNPDDIKAEMAKRGMVPKIDELSPAEAGVFIHEEASQLAEDLSQRIHAKGKNMIWDVTLNSVKSGNKRIDPLHAATAVGGIGSKYHVAGAFVDVSPAQSAKNAEQRHRKGQDRFAAGVGEGGRYVPSDLIVGAADPSGQYRTKNRAAFEQLKSRFDQTLTIDNENYAGKLINETGSDWYKSQKLKRRDEAPKTSDITDQIMAYRNGDSTLDELTQSLGSRTYDRPGYFDQEGATEDDIENVDHYQPGTWGEVRQAHNYGLLSDDEYNRIADAAYQQHNGQRGELVTRNWAKWNAEHPWIKKGRKHKMLPDLTKHYTGRDLHAEGEWPIGHNPRYGLVTFNKEGTHVLLREPKNHFDGYNWTFAKGGPDPGESHVAVAHRESMEEMGRQPRIVSHLKGRFGAETTQTPYVDKYGNPHHADGSWDEAPWTDDKGVHHPGGHHEAYQGSANYFYLSQDDNSTPDYEKVKANGETTSVGYFTPEEAKARISEGTNKGGVARDLRVLDAAVKEMDRLQKGGSAPPIRPHKYPSAPPVKPKVVNPVAKPSPGEGHSKPAHQMPATPLFEKPTSKGSPTKSPAPKKPKLQAPYPEDLTWEQLIAKGKKKYGNRQWLTDMLNFRFDWKHGWIPVSPAAYAELAKKAEEALAKSDASHHQAAEQAHHLADLAQQAQAHGDLHQAMVYAAQAHGASIHADAKKEAEATTHAAEEAKLHEFASKAGAFGSKSPNLGHITEHTPSHIVDAESTYFEKGAPSTGSNPGNWYTHKGSGDKYLVKQAKTPEHAYNEVASTEVYHQAEAQGLTPNSITPNVTLIKANDGTVAGVVSHEVKAQHPFEFGIGGHQSKAREAFGIDALTSHWDFAGLPTGDNIKATGTKVVRIDTGGAMAFRAMGGKKDSFKPGAEWKDHQTLRTSTQGKEAYGPMSDAEAAASLEAAAKIDLNQVAERWKAAGIPESVSAPWLATLRDRQAQIPDIVAKLKGEEKPKVEPTFAKEFLPPTPKQAPHVVAAATVSVPAAPAGASNAASHADLPAYLKTGGSNITEFHQGHLEGQAAAAKMLESGKTPTQVKAKGSKLAGAAKKAKENGNLEAHANLFGQYKAHYAAAKTGKVPSGEAQKVEHVTPAPEVETPKPELTLPTPAEAESTLVGSQLVEYHQGQAKAQANLEAAGNLSVADVNELKQEAIDYHIAKATEAFDQGNVNTGAKHLGMLHGYQGYTAPKAPAANPTEGMTHAEMMDFYAKSEPESFLKGYQDPLSNQPAGTYKELMAAAAKGGMHKPAAYNAGAAAIATGAATISRPKVPSVPTSVSELKQTHPASYQAGYDSQHAELWGGKTADEMHAIASNMEQGAQSDLSNGDLTLGAYHKGQADKLHEIGAAKEAPSEPKVAEPTFHYEAPKVPEEHTAHGAEFLAAHEAAFKAGQEMHAAGMTKQQIKAAGSNKGYKKIATATTDAEKAHYYGTAQGYYAAAKQIPGPATPKKSKATPEAVAAGEAVNINIAPAAPYDYSGVSVSDWYGKGLEGVVQPTPGHWEPGAATGVPTYPEVKIEASLPKGWESLKAEPAFDLPSHDQATYITAYKNGKDQGAQMTLEELASKISSTHEAYMAATIDTPGESHELGLKNGYEMAYDDKAKVQNLSAAEQAQMQTKAKFMTEYAKGKYADHDHHFGDAGKQDATIQTNPHGQKPAGATAEHSANYDANITQGYDEATHALYSGVSPEDVAGMAAAHLSKGDSLVGTDLMLATTHQGLAQGASKAAGDFHAQNNFQKASTKSIIHSVKVEPSSLQAQAITTTTKPGSAGFEATSVSLQVHHHFTPTENAAIKSFTKYYRSTDTHSLESGHLSGHKKAFTKELNDIWQQKSTGSNNSQGAVEARAFINAVSTKAIPNKSQMQRKITAQPNADWYKFMFFRPDGTPKGPGDHIDLPVQSWSTNKKKWSGDVWIVADEPGTMSLDIGSASSVSTEIETVTGGRFVIKKVAQEYSPEEHKTVTKIYVRQEKFYAR